jgi:SNF2-related domain
MIQSKLFPPSSTPWNPHAYQKKAIKFLLEHAASALFLDPGLGKTSITLAAIKILKQKKLLNKVLLIAPLRVCHLVWPLESEKWADFNGLKVVVLHGPNKDALLKTEADIYVINPEGLICAASRPLGLTPWLWTSCQSSSTRTPTALKALSMC